MLHNKFAVIKLWPDLKAAEDECIARLKIAAQFLGVECIEVDAFARLRQPPHTRLTRHDVDFVLSLHYDTPKQYDIFSFVALWNPLQFYHEWGYRRCTTNLLTHDDFLSCSSPWADDQVRRNLANDPSRQGPYFELYHSLAEPMYPPSLGEQKLFYTGINWERLGRKPGRHHSLLKLLDPTGCLRIYGPKTFQGVKVWEGYQSYVAPIPFDGVSIIREINKAGIALVLSSEAHVQSELMSSRLFESLAAGAVIICDENPFGHRYFKDTLLYIETSCPAEETLRQVQSHLHWIQARPAEALDMAKRAQEIFREKFTLRRSLEKIYSELPARKHSLEVLYRPVRNAHKLSLVLLMPDYTKDILERHLTSCMAQQNVCFSAVLAVSCDDFGQFGPLIQKRFDDERLSVTIAPLKSWTAVSKRSSRRTRIGQALNEVFARVVMEDYFCVVAPNEELFSDHLVSLLWSLENSPDCEIATSRLVLAYQPLSGERRSEVDPGLDLSSFAPKRPLGMGRFLFRKAALKPDLCTVLPYLDTLAMHALVGSCTVAESKRCSVLLDMRHDFNTQFQQANEAEERQLLSDYVPSVFKPETAAVNPWGAFEWLDVASKTRIAVELAHSIPLPAFLSGLAFRVYRWWHRRRKGGRMSS